MHRWWQVTATWTADEEPDPTARAAEVLDALAPFHVGAVLTPGDDGRWSTTVSVFEAKAHQAVATALVVVTSSARAAGMTKVDAVEVHARLQPTPPGSPVAG